MPLIGGSRVIEWRCRDLRVVAAPETMPPFPVDVIVEEQDCALLLTVAEDPPRSTEQPAWYLANVLHRQPEMQPGTARLITDTAPARIQAIVYDVEQEVICREQWLSMALENTLSIVGTRHYRRLALPLLGLRYSTMSLHTLLAVFNRELAKAEIPALTCVWLQIPENFDCDALLDIPMDGATT